MSIGAKIHLDHSPKIVGGHLVPRVSRLVRSVKKVTLPCPYCASGYLEETCDFEEHYMFSLLATLSLFSVWYGVCVFSSGDDSRFSFALCSKFQSCAHIFIFICIYASFILTVEIIDFCYL